MQHTRQDYEHLNEVHIPPGAKYQKSWGHEKRGDGMHFVLGYEYWWHDGENYDSVFIGLPTAELYKTEGEVATACHEWRQRGTIGAVVPDLVHEMDAPRGIVTAIKISAEFLAVTGLIAWFIFIAIRAGVI